MTRSILKSLLKAEAYPEPTGRITLVQTHVSWIFLTDQHAYKVKKPVDFGFLNFSTIDRRRFYCNEEIKYNRRLCPDIYEGVVEVRQTAAGAAFHGNGPIIDYAVKMKRLPAERMLDNLIASGRASAEELREVARVIAEFHGRAATSPAIAEYGKLDRILFNWQENFDQTTPFSDSTLPTTDRELIRNWVYAFAENNGEIFQQRIRNGYIRECDGDIHLENICLTEQGICIFDCIEFNERFRCCDTAADVAFLLMDLDYHGRHDLAEEVIAAYQQASRDEGLEQLIDFYKVYRAFVRGKVESFRLNDSGLTPLEREQAVSRAIRYFRLARGYIQRRALSPTLFITCGLMGCGKSTLAEQLAFELGLPLFSSDRIRKETAGIPVERPVNDPFGQGLYTAENVLATYGQLLQMTEEQLTRGTSAIVDASFIAAEQRAAFSQLAARHGFQLVILQVSCSETEQRRRLSERSSTGRSTSDGRNEILASQRQQFQPPEPDEGRLIHLHSAEGTTALVNGIYAELS